MPSPCVGALSPDFLSLCWQAGVPPDSLNRIGATALHVAAYRGKGLEALKLVEYGADINVADHVRSPSALLREKCVCTSRVPHPQSSSCHNGGTSPAVSGSILLLLRYGFVQGQATDPDPSLP